MTNQRFIEDGIYVRDTEDIIPPIMTHSYAQLCEFLDGLNHLSNENKSLKEQKRVLQDEWKNILSKLEELESLRKENELLEKALALEREQSLLFKTELNETRKENHILKEWTKRIDECYQKNKGMSIYDADWLD